MAHSVPTYSRSEVNAAGATLVSSLASGDDAHQARLIVNNWRASHSFPLNFFSGQLKRNVKAAGGLVSQRLKRLPSIEDKLRRFESMKLTQIQDIAGCRAVLDNTDAVWEVASRYERSDREHKTSDYLASPRDSGYRGFHLVYRYETERENYAPYNGMKVEVQLRSRMQHVWATAVETVDTFTGQALKASHGQELWLRFFALMSSDLAITEGLPPVPETPGDRGALRSEITRCARELDAVARLEAYGSMARIIERLDDRFRKAVRKNVSLIHIRMKRMGDGVAEVRWRPYTPGQWERALEAYEEAEEEIEGRHDEETVLVEASSLEDLKRAYPNYFVDTSMFVQELKKALA